MSATDAGTTGWYRGGVVAVLLLGVAARLLYVVHAPGLRSDEAKVALEIGMRSVGELLRPLDFGQAAPPGFLLVEKGLFILGSGADWVLRLLPLGASVAALLWFRRLAEEVLSRVPALAALALFAFAPGVVLFAWQVKPYAVDALVAIALMHLGLAGSRPGSPMRLVTRLGVAGLIAVVLSIPAPFVLGGIGGGVLLRRWSEPSVRRSLVGWALAWLLAFAVIATTVYPSSRPGSYLHDYWRGAFLDLRHPVEGMKLGLRLLNGWFLGVDAGSVYLVVAAAALVLLAITGLRFLIRRSDRGALLVLASPLILALIASQLERWPVAPRLLMFAAPSVVIVVAAGLESFFAGPRIWRTLGGGIAAGVALLPALDSVPPAFLQRFPLEQRDVAFAGTHRGPDPVYIAPRSLPMWLFYSTDWARPQLDRLRLAARLSSPGGVSFPNLAPEDLANQSPPAPARYRGFLEFWGRASGVQDDYTEIAHAAPTPDWGPSEADRIRSLGADDVRLFLWGATASERTALVAGLRTRGMTVDERRGHIPSATTRRSP